MVGVLANMRMGMWLTRCEDLGAGYVPGRFCRWNFDELSRAVNASLAPAQESLWVVDKIFDPFA